MSTSCTQIRGFCQVSLLVGGICIMNAWVDWHFSRRHGRYTRRYAAGEADRFLARWAPNRIGISSIETRIRTTSISIAMRIYDRSVVGLSRTEDLVLTYFRITKSLGGRRRCRLAHPRGVDTSQISRMHHCDTSIVVNSRRTGAKDLFFFFYLDQMSRGTWYYIKSD